MEATTNMTTISTFDIRENSTKRPKKRRKIEIPPIPYVEPDTDTSSEEEEAAQSQPPNGQDAVEVSGSLNEEETEKEIMVRKVQTRDEKIHKCVHLGRVNNLRSLKNNVRSISKIL